jgi:hypothetical protein
MLNAVLFFTEGLKTDGLEMEGLEREGVKELFYAKPRKHVGSQCHLQLHY